MKRLLPNHKLFFVLFLALFAGMGTAYAYDFSAQCPTGQTLYYNITDANNHYVEITFPGPNNYNPWGNIAKPTGDITLPSTVTYNGINYSVEAIGEFAFYECSGLTGTLTLPNSVNTIGNDAFHGCSGFTGSLTIPNSVTTIGEEAFAECSGFNGSLSISDSVYSIGFGAFGWCPNFTGTLTLPNSLTEIEAFSFYQDSHFTGSLTIPNSVTSIGQNAFSGCSGFNGSLTLSQYLLTIGNDAFINCSGFSGTLTIPTYVNTVGSGAFAGCRGFTGLTFGDYVTTIGSWAFDSCFGFTGSLTIPNTVTTIGENAFSNCLQFNGTLTIGAGVTSMGTSAFSYCSGLTSIIALPETPPALGTDVFANVPTAIPVTVPCGKVDAYQSVSGWDAFTNMQEDCDFLIYSINPDGVSVTVTGHLDGTAATGELIIPETKVIDGVSYTVTAINGYAFYNCSGLTGSLTIPNTITTIGSRAFDGCTGFTGSLTIGNSVTTIGNGAFNNCTGFTGSLILPNSVISIDNYSFFGCTGFTGSLTIPNSVTEIGHYAFTWLSGLTGSLTIPNSITEIPEGAFEYCQNLSGNLILPNSLTTIGYGAFLGCHSFTGPLTIPNSVTTIGDYAFSGCFGFTGALTIGHSVTSIGESAFKNCSDLISIMVYPETPPTLGTDAFANVPKNIPVYVPCGSLADYQVTLEWSEFTNMQCIPETLTVYEGTSTSYTVPANITYFDDFTRSQFVIPADELVEMRGTPITRMTFYTTNIGVPYTTVSSADVYLKEVNYTTINAFEPKASATIVYSGYFNIVNSGDGGEMTINFDTPFTYNGGNLLVGIENIEDNGWTYIYYYGQPVSGASISGSNSISAEAISAQQQNFIPKTTFGFVPTCEAKSLPYAYGFEEADEMDCWTMLDCTVNNTGIMHGSNAAHSGNYGFRFFYNTNPPQYLISPKFEGTTDMEVSFYYKNISNTYPETFQVGYSTTTKSPDAFAWGEEVIANDESTWMLYENFFPAGTKYVAVKLNSNDMDCLFLDDFSFEPVLPCTAPSNLTVTNITANSAYLYWTGDQDNYNVRYRMVPGGSWIVETALPNSFVDNFESGLGNWTLIDADGDGHNWSLNADLHLNGSPHGGDDMVVSESWTHTDGALDPDNFLVTPQVVLGGTVTFWASAVDPVYCAEHFGIAVSTNSNTDPADFTLVQEWTMTAKGEPHGGPRGTRSDNTWYQYSVDLSAFAGQTGYIAIRHFNCPDQDALCVDDFSYGNEIPSITLGDLNPLTTYEVQMQGVCPYGFSDWSEPVSFTTAIPTFPYGDYLGTALYDVQTNSGARTWTHVWPDGKVNFAFMTASILGYNDRGTGIGTYDSATDVWIPSMGRVENERTGFGSIAQYGVNGIVVAAHTNTSNIYIISDKDDIATGSAVKVGNLDSTHEPYWPNVMTSGANRDIIHVIAQGSDDFVVYYFRSRDGGQTWDRQNVILPYMGTDYCSDWMVNCYYWMETTDDNCLALVVNNPWSDGMVLYSYDDGDTWERKVFYKHPDPFGSFEDPFYYPRWTSCQWDSQHHLHVLYELGALDSNNEYLDLGGVAYWNETMPYNANGTTVSAFEGNLVPGQPFVLESAYLENDIYRSWWHYTDATHEMWPEYIGYLAPLTDEGDPEDPYQASGFNIENEDLGQHGYYRSGVCGYPVLCMVPNSDEMVAVWSALDENHMDVNGNYYYKIFASYSKNKGATWSPMVQLTKDFDNAEFVYNQAAVVGRKLVIATQTDGETGTYYNGYYGTDTDVYDSYYLGMVFDLDELFDTSSSSQTIALSAGWNWFSTYIDKDPVELLEMLEEGLGEDAIQIKSQTQATAWDGDEEEWSGRLQGTGLTNDKTYMVQLPANTTITVTLVGPAATPEGCTIELNPNGWTWIGFPSAVEMDVNEALAGFEAMAGDQLKSRNQTTAWDEDEEEWSGRLNTLVPGQGYMFYSNSSEPRTLVFQTGAKAKADSSSGKHKE